ncbi:glucoamylase [Candidatus Woesearchaeota archaeon]|nr:MAG: glucoamylase [Candidatus Woesearchaeota archaeon]
MIDRKKAERIYAKSIEVLKEVQLKNGGCLATPKGERYPYVYPRDHAIILLGMMSAGLHRRAKKGLQFVLDCQLESGAFPQRIDVDGNDASYKPIQIDGTGLVLYALSQYVEETSDLQFAEDNWDIVKKAAAYIINNVYPEKNLVYTPNSIHEFPPTEAGHEIWANAVCQAALEKLYNLAVKLNHPHQEWKEYSVMIKEGMLKYMWNSRIKSFVKTIRVKEASSVLIDPDASKYAVADYGVLPDDDSRVKSTVAEIEKNLWNRQLGGLCRYPKYEGRNNGGWGPWPHFTLMVARHYIRLGNRKKADKYMQWVLDIAWKDMLPEHISTVAEFEEYVHDFTEAGLLRKDRLVLIENARKHPMFKKGTAYITTPLAWPHAEFIRTWNLYKEKFS